MNKFCFKISDKHKRKMESGLKNWLILVLVLILISEIGFVGLLVEFPENLNFLFENMLWFPIELLVMLIFIDRIVKKNNEKIEAIREFSEYYSVAGDSLVSLVKTIKYQMISGINNEMTEDENIDERFVNICNNLNDFISVNKLREGHIAPIIDQNNLWDSIENIQYQRISYYQSLPNSGKIILTNIEEHYTLFLKYMPIDLFKEVNSVYMNLEKHVFFSRNEFHAIGRNALLQREQLNCMRDEEYQDTVNLLLTFYNEMSVKVLAIEKLIETNHKKISD